MQKVQTANVARTHWHVVLFAAVSHAVIVTKMTEEEGNEDANESNDSSEDEKDEELLEEADKNSDIYELETENDDENAGILDMLAEPQNIGTV